jgi:hypothetical protein
MEKFTKKSATLLTALTLIPVLGGVLSVSADDVASYNSTGSITFQAGTQVTTPVDPSNPTQPVDPVDPENSIDPGTAGPLSIDFASNWNFGTQDVTAQDTVYNAQPQALSDGTAVPLYAQVTDTRGTFEGWALSLTQDSQFEDDSNNQLTGAQLSFKGVGKTASTSDVQASNVQDSSFDLTPGVEQPLLSANVDEGTGTNTYAFGDISDYDTSATDGVVAASKSPVHLSVKGGSMRATNYTTHLVWTLSDTPAP